MVLPEKKETKKESEGRADRCASSFSSGRRFHIRCSGLPGRESLVRFPFVSGTKCTNEVNVSFTNSFLLLRCESVVDVWVFFVVFF